MIRLHCTRKLVAKLSLLEDGRLQKPHTETPLVDITAESLLGHWHANLILLQRRQCVLFVHDATRFPVFIPALKKHDFSALEFLFEDVLMNTLLKIGADETAIDKAHTALEPFLCDSDCSRSVQGTMNQMAQDIEAQLAYDHLSVMDIGPYSASAWLAERPCTVKGIKDCVWPHQAFLDLLHP